MKILQVITTLRAGGAEKLLADMVPLFCKHGYQVDVLVFDGVDSFFKQKLQEAGVQVYQLGYNCSVYNPIFIVKLIGFIKSYDVVHTHNTVCQYFVALAKYISLSRVKLVTTEHNTTNRRRKICWFKLIDKFIYRQYEAIICASDKISENLIQYLGCKLTIYTIYNGICLSYYKKKRAFNRKDIIPDDITVVITMIAKFRPQKDHETLIRSLSFLPVEYGLCLVGDINTSSYPICEKLSRDLNVHNRVFFLGTRSDIPEILSVSDVVVMSSHWEGFGLAAVEAMAARKPVIASDVPGLAEVVKDAGILFPKGDEKRLAAEIERLMNDYTFYNQIADQCLARSSEYDICKTVAEYENVWRSL